MFSRRLRNGLSTAVVGLCTLIATPLAAQQAGTTPRTKIDVSKLGPQVGQAVPDFSLSDQTGKVWTRASIMGPKGALLLFYRSADWCPYCKTQLMDLQSRLGELRAKGLGVAAISYDPVPTLAEFATRRQIAFASRRKRPSATSRACAGIRLARQRARVAERCGTRRHRCEGWDGDTRRGTGATGPACRRASAGGHGRRS